MSRPNGHCLIWGINFSHQVNSRHLMVIKTRLSSLCHKSRVNQTGLSCRTHSQARDAGCVRNDAGSCCDDNWCVCVRLWSSRTRCKVVNYLENKTASSLPSAVRIPLAKQECFFDGGVFCICAPFHSRTLYDPLSSAQICWYLIFSP